MLTAASFLRTVKRSAYLVQRGFAGVTVAQIKELRNMTGSSIDECKKALEAEQGDMAKAKEYLKTRGLAQASKKGARDASEGLIGVRFTRDQNTAIVAEVNCETDFVAKTELFQKYVGIVLSTLCQQPNLPELNFTKYESGVEEEINKILKTPLAERINIEGHECSDLFEAKQLAIAKLQENIKVRKLYSFKRNPTIPGVIGHYVHMTTEEGIGKSCCLIDVECGAQNTTAVRDIANNFAMQILGTKPDFLRREDIPAHILAREVDKVKEVMKDAIKGKPQNVADRMIEGKLKKFLEESVLYYQEYMIENESGKTVEEYLKQQEKVLGSSIKLNKFKVIGAGLADESN